MKRLFLFFPIAALTFLTVAFAAEGEHMHAKMDPAQAELGASAAFDASQ